MERKSLKIWKTHIQSSAVQGLLFGSSSSVMLRLIGHGVVSEKNNASSGSPRGASFHRRNETFPAAMRPLHFPAQFAAFLYVESNSNFQLQRFATRAVY